MYDTIRYDTIAEFNVDQCKSNSLIMRYANPPI